MRQYTYQVQQECYQILHQYRDQFTAYRKAFERLGLKVGVSFQKNKILQPYRATEKGCKKMGIEEHQAKLFLPVADKLIEDLKNDV